MRQIVCLPQALFMVLQIIIKLYYDIMSAAQVLSHAITLVGSLD